MKPPIPRIRLSPIKPPSTPLIVPQLNQRSAEASVAVPEVRGPIPVPVPVPGSRSLWGVEPVAVASAPVAPVAAVSVPEMAVVPVAVPVALGAEAAVSVESVGSVEAVAGADSVANVEAVATAEVEPNVATTAAAAGTMGRLSFAKPAGAPVAAVQETSAEAEFTLPVPAAPAAGSGEAGAEEPVSTGVMNHSSSPALIRASSMVFKWALIGGTLLAVAFVAVRYLVPIINELRATKSTAPVVVDKNASTAVKAIQATRQVVAKGDANVAYLNEVVGAVDNKPVVTPPVPAPKPVAAAAPRAAGSPVGAPAVVDLAAYHEAIARMKVDSVSRGPQPKAFIDGRLVKEGEIINRQLGLRFVGVEEDEHALLFTNAENVTFRKFY